MSSVPMPRDLSEEAVAAFMREVCCLNVQRIPAAELREWERSSGKEGWRIVAAHVRALLREKVREAVALSYGTSFTKTGAAGRNIVSRVLGDHPQGGHEAEGREEAPRG